MNARYYEEGQRWTYRARPQDVGSTLLIGRIDPGSPPVIHVRIYGVVWPPSSQAIVMGHLPFSTLAIDDSVLDLVESGIEIPEDFEAGLSAWAEQQGGVFDVTVSAAIEDAVSAAANAVNGDVFDALVSQLRATPSQDLVEQLYRRLFALEQWFFLKEPDNPAAAVQWQFPDGMNPRPALLAFTSRSRAESAAVSLGLYPEGARGSVMAAPIRDAVRWIASPQCGNEWLCSTWAE